MADTEPKALQGGADSTSAVSNVTNPGSVDNPGSATTATQDDDPEITTYTPDEKKKEVLRILRWPARAFYEILELAEDATGEGIKKAYHKKSKLTHTDRNDDVDAKDVFQRVTKAHETLSDPVKRKEYDDVERPDQKKKNLLVPKEFDETFARNAYGEGDGQSKDDDTDDDDDDDDDDKPMSEAKKKIIAQMKPYVIAALESGKSAPIKELKKLDKELVEQNRLDGVFANDRSPPVAYIKTTGKKYSDLIKMAAGKVETQQDVRKIRDAESALVRLKEQVKERMEELKLPLDWTFSLPRARQDLGPEGVSNTARPSQGSQPDRSSQSQGQEAPPDPMDIDPKPTDVNVNWEPGQTTRGEKILGYRPIVKRFREKGTQRWVETESCSDYVIEKKDQANPIELVGAGQIGEDAIKAFLALPEDRKASLSLTNIDQKYTRAHGDSITEILGHARSSSLTPAGRLPLTFLLIKYDREERLINRSAQRKAKGDKYAGDMIAAFLEKIGEPPEESKADRLALTAQDADNRREIEESRQSRRVGGRVAPNTPVSSASRSLPVTNTRNRQSSTNDFVTQDALKDALEGMMKSILTQMTDQMKDMQLVTAR